MLPETIMQKAVADRDEAYDGTFFYAVITTGVFCKPSCPSKAAKAENLRYYSSIENAMRAGFRPCQRCEPVGHSSQSERLIKTARYIEQHAQEKLTLEKLSEVANLSASRLQRVFKDFFGISPKVYQDAIRMRYFKHALKQGNAITDAIFDSGFSSVSRIYGEANRHIGMTPAAYREGGKGEIIHYVYRETALGLMLMAATDTDVCFVQFGKNQEALLSLLKDEFPKAILTPSPAPSCPDLTAWVDALNTHISENTPRPAVPLDMRGTAFQMKVWKFLISVKEGDVISYSELASGIDKPKAIRAAASACAKNRIAILIPCHRVIRGDGSPGGYRWGLDRKRALLDKEKRRV